MATEREFSVEASSYNEEMNPDVDNEDGDYGKQGLIEHNEDDDEDLHPLREAANRVGREVERFAEVLDGYNPLRAMKSDEKYEMTLDMIDLYYETALETLTGLREQHQAERRRKDGLSWRKKMRGFKITLDDEDMAEDDDENQFPDPQTTVDDLVRWEQEAQTWDLLRRLVQHRFPPPASKNKKAKTKQKLNRYSSEREVWDEFLESEPLALERRIVLQWLKDTAEESGEEIDVLVHDLQQNAERGDIIAHGWIHTKAAIKNQKRLRCWPQALDPTSAEIQRVHLNSAGTEPLITQLDPDATTRQGRKLEAQDEYFERAIWLGCYEMLRRGKDSAEIKDWCTERTEVWRAISMSGLPDETIGGEEDEAGDPTSNALWRRMCFALARKGGGDEYERAVYGILSGDISSVEPVCRSWDDFIFAHYNALLRTQFDNHLQKQYPHSVVPGIVSNFGSFDAVQFHGEPSTAGKKLIETLKTDPRTSAETLQPMKMLQGVLLADQFEHFIHQQGLAFSKSANANTPSYVIPATDEELENDKTTRYVAMDDHDSLRVLTHVLLVFMSLGLNLGGAVRQTMIQNVIVAYISFLRLAGKEELIPLYSSQLSGSRRYATLCRSLIDVTDHEQRVTQISLMREMGLDVQQFVKFQSRYLCADYPYESDKTGVYPAAGKFSLLETSTDSLGPRVKRDIFGDDPDKVDRIDLLFIRSLEWYLLVDGLWSETFSFGSWLYLRFLKNMRLTAARMLATRISSAEIARVKTRAIVGHSLAFEQLEYSGEDEDLTEVLDGSADEKRLLKKHLVAEAKSFRELESLISSLEAMDTIASLGHLMKDETDPTVNKKMVRYNLASQAQQIRTTAKPLFQGWLLTTQKEDDDGFKKTREVYLPETILAYISTLQLSGEQLSRDLLMECMDLSALLAAENSDILKTFMKVGRMPALVEAFAYAGKSLLLITSSRGGTSRTKKTRAKGWSPELWTVKT